MIRLKCIIVDDEPASLSILEHYVKDCPQLYLIQACTNAFEAMDVIREEKVELIFLDINMPKLNGLSFYKTLVDPPPVIFTTAYSKYAVEGFEVNALDYLLKPFSFERFLKAVNKAIDKVSSESQATTEHILLKADKKVHRILLDSITHLMAVGDYVKVYFAENNIMVHSTFQDILAKLPKDKIIRVHKSYAVAISKIDVIEGNTIIMKDERIAVGSTFRSALLAALKGH